MLVATDIAARGIHVDDIDLVVHVDPPAEHKAYLHRSGRTARAGAAGVVITVQSPAQAGDVRVLMRQAGVAPLTASVSPGSALLRSIAGPRAAQAAQAARAVTREAPPPAAPATGSAAVALSADTGMPQALTIPARPRVPARGQGREYLAAAERYT